MAVNALVLRDSRVGGLSVVDRIRSTPTIQRDYSQGLWSQVMTPLPALLLAYLFEKEKTNHILWFIMRSSVT